MKPEEARLKYIAFNRFTHQPFYSIHHENLLSSVHYFTVAWLLLDWLLRVKYEWEITALFWGSWIITLPGAYLNFSYYRILSNSPNPGEAVNYLKQYQSMVMDWWGTINWKLRQDSGDCCVASCSGNRYLAHTYSLKYGLNTILPLQDQVGNSGVILELNNICI